MTAGSGSDKFTASQLEAALIKTYGPDFRDKVIVGPLGSFRLAEAFEECGLVDPQTPPPPGPAYGLWQISMGHEQDVARRTHERYRVGWETWRSAFALVLNETCAKRGGKCDCAEGVCRLDEA